MTQAVTVAQAGSSNLTMRNRIINGAMQINQRGNDGLLTSSSAREYRSCDRWAVYQSTASKLSINQQTSSPPAGFSSYLTITTTNAQNSSADLYVLQQIVEGYSLAGTDFGTSNAKQFTLSFWVKSSLTGTFGLQFGDNNGNAYSTMSSYTINNANTWEFKSITWTTPPTAGTWNLNNNSFGAHISWDLGCGSNNNGAVQSVWANGSGWGLTGGQKLVNNANATWSITGVQLEIGTQPTSFEYRSYGTEFALCQRYYQRNFVSRIYGSSNGSTTNFYGHGTLHQTMRATPSMGLISGTTGASNQAIDYMGQGNRDYSTGSPNPKSPNAFKFDIGIVSTIGNYMWGTVVNDICYADAEL